MEAFVSIFFVFVLSVLGVSNYPEATSSTWSIQQKWQPDAKGFTTVLSSAEIGHLCARDDEQFLVFPQVIHSYQEIFADGKMVGSFGNKNFLVASPFYEQNYISCKILKSSTRVDWKATTYSQFFARIKTYPVLSANPFSLNIFSITANILAFGSLLVLSIFCLYLFKGKVSNLLTYSISASSFLFSIYFLNAVNTFFNLNLTMLESHKLADTCLWIAGGLITSSYYFDNLLRKTPLYFFVSSIAVGISFIVTGSNPDIVQFGTTVPMVGWLICNIDIMLNLATRKRNSGFNQYILLKGFSVLAFIVAGINDVFSIFGVTNTELYLPVGLVLGIFGVAVSVNQNIEATYKERDNLLINLENKVVEKTKHLEEALTSLKSTQAELVQSAKLASLGTVSAGIAHEINNSINYVSGAIPPLEKRVYALIPESADRKMIEKLFAAIKEGTSLTVDIVKSLRNFTGLNQAEFKEVRITESVHSIQTILKSKLRGVDFKHDIADDCITHGNLVGLNQVFMNLITNSLDALDKDQKFIHITGSKSDNMIRIVIKDNGKGIDSSVVSRIFDPFFTTKDVGKGTGLGLHIVSKEIERHGGQIKVFSELNVGTQFVITLPALVDSNKIREAA